MNTLNSVLQPASPSHTAIIIPDGPRVSYREFATEIERVAGLLAGAGVSRQRSVSIVLPNTLEFMSVFLATAQAGAIAAPLNSAYTLDEFKFFMEDAAAQFAIVPPGPHAGRDAATQLGIPVIEASLDGAGRTVLARNGAALTAHRDPAPPSPDDVALFLHTSGTTSRPKGVPLRHANLMASLKNIRDTYALTPDDISLIVMPLFHVHGLLGATLSTLNSGGAIVIPPRFSASAFWPVQKATRSTWYSAVPTIHQVLLQRADEDGAPHESFRFIRSCSSALVPAVFEKLEARFGSPVLEAYGMTEASHQMSSNPLPPGKRLPGSVGAGTGVEIAIFEMDRPGTFTAPGHRGEVVIKGPNVMHGYNNNPKANTESFVNGWFRTGDQGFLDEKKYLTLTGRIKELINRAGEKISPLEVDAVLLQHPAVTEAVCFAVPDEKYGEVVQAAVVLRGNSDEATLRAFCAERLAKFKVPDRIYIADKLPRTATGKIQRRHVSTAFAGSKG
ncbi:MAG: AMP-dependent synthetase [Dehalococcoidia bacterium]|nr:AMP-dependent synthetase [Dehalococcoidia bacterium]MSQ34929.1 AMP-dependent synthetase [Dehalococcoidia bacterium]